MSYYKYFPTPSDRMGALWTLDSIEDACIIEFGPAGTTHFSIEGIVNLNGESQARLFTTHISEHDLTFGKTDRLEASIKEVDENFKPKVIFVFSSSLTSIIGIDIKSVCVELEDQVDAKLVAVDTGGFKGDFSLGVRQMLKKICEEVVIETSMKDHKKYNIIGGQLDEYNNRSDIKEIQLMMKEIFDLDCHCVLSHESSIDNIEEMSKASFNIVLRSEGLDAAKVLEKRFNQPYTKRRPYGSLESEKFISEVEDIVGLVRNHKIYEKSNELLSRAIYRLEMLNKYDDYKVLVSGNVDMTSGVIKLLKEMGFSNIKGIVNHKKPKRHLNDLEDNLVYSASEQDKKRILKEFAPDIVLGDAVLIRFANDFGITKSMQISNPNIDSIIFYDKTPYLGINGGTYLCEQVANMLKDIKYNK